MKKTITFKNLILFSTLLITLMLSLSLTIKEETRSVSQDQVIYMVNDIDEAMILADTYHLSFNKLSSYGVATFNLTNKANMDQLLESGFAYNGISQSVAPKDEEPTDEDPLRKDQYALELMDTIEAWEVTEGDNDITVAIIDSGIDIGHEEFAGRISTNSYNAVTETVGLDAVIDDNGHGTMVAGIIGAEKYNGTGIAGIASNVELLVIKANAEGTSDYLDSAIIEGIYYAVDHGADIINLSFGGNNNNIFKKLAINHAVDQGVLVVAAAGNDASDEPFYPAAYEGTISVSSVNENALIAPYSNFGEFIDIAAPGTRIVTTFNYNGYGTISGTSFAAPQITGLLALMLSYFPDMDNEEIIQRLYLSSIDYGEEGIDHYYGHGLANTYNALTYDNVYKVSFQTYGGTLIDPVYQLGNTFITSPTPPILEDYFFLGWYKDFELTEPWDFDNDLITEDTILHAKYDKDFHDVTFIVNGEETETITVNDGETISLPSITLDGYNFKGWTLDEENQNPFEASPVYNNLILYAHFEEIVYHDINIFIEDELKDTISIESGTTYQPETYELMGHTFAGWYLDETYTTLYDSNEPIDSAINLYAKFDPMIYDVTLMVNGEVYQTLDVAYEEIPDLPSPTNDSGYFIDWYLSDDYEEVYNNTPIKDNIRLYARFETDVQQVTLILDESMNTKWRIANELFEPYTPFKEGYTFNGWYYDQDYTDPYEPILLDQDITLYAYFELEYFTVKFYDGDHETIFYETEVSYGENVSPPGQPNPPQSISYNYTFESWSEEFNHITQDLEVYPNFSREYIPGYITINPGVDSLEAGGEWIDAGITELDPWLTLKTIQQVNPEYFGRYIVHYLIYEDDVIIDRITRVVTVTHSKPNVIITLNESITTIPVGGKYNETGANTNIGEVMITSNVDTSQAGTYTVVYKVNVDGVLYKKTRFVHVIDNNITKHSQVVWYKEERDQYVS